MFMTDHNRPANGMQTLLSTSLDQASARPALFEFELDGASPSATSAPINISGRTNVPTWSGSQWDSLDFTQRLQNDTTPSYQGSFRNSYESELSWGGREDADPVGDDVEYDPVQYDNNHHSPMMLLSETATSFHDFFTSEDPVAFSTNAQTLSYSATIHPSQHFSPRTDQFSVPSPSSSAGGGDSGNEGRHSRASSVSSQRPPIPSSPGLAVNDAFNKLAFDPVEADLQWRKANMGLSPSSPPLQPTSPAMKPQSPPTLVIPSDPGNNNNSMPSLFNSGPGLAPAPQLGLIPGPSINIVPSTPVSGGGGSASNEPFQQLLQTLNTAQRGGGAGNHSVATHGRLTPSMPASTDPQAMPSSTSQHDTASTMNIDDWSSLGLPPPQPSSSSNYQDITFDFHSNRQQARPSASGSSPFPFPPANTHSAPNPDLLGYPSSAARPRSRSDTSTSTRPSWGGLIGASSAPTGHSGHSHGQGTVNPNHISQSALSSSYHESSMHSNLTHESLTSFLSPSLGASSSDDLSLGTGLGLGMGPSVASVRRARSDGGGASRHGRGSRSEDFSRGNELFTLPATRPIVTPDGSLAPGDPRYATSSNDPRFTNFGGPARHSHNRRASGGAHSRTSSIGSSSRVSPYPSPSGSPAHVHESLPPYTNPHPSLPSPYIGASLGGNGNSGRLVGESSPPPPVVHSQPARSQVTTPATHKASEARRKQEANFACPVPGCGSTFTRHFNLKGHLRSHNDERPFKCKWTGCGKGFARRHDCRRHESLHLNHRPYTCDGCQKTFARMDALNRHLKSEGGIECRSRHSGDNDISDETGRLKTEDGGWGSGNSGGGGYIM